MHRARAAPTNLVQEHDADRCDHIDRDEIHGMEIDVGSIVLQGAHQPAAQTTAGSARARVLVRRRRLARELSLAHRGALGSSRESCSQAHVRRRLLGGRGGGLGSGHAREQRETQRERASEQEQ